MSPVAVKKAAAAKEVVNLGEYPQYMRKHGPSYDAAHTVAQHRYPSGAE